MRNGDSAHENKKSTLSARLVRPTRKKWAPLVGDDYADQIAQATLWRMLRLPCVLILLIPINVLRFSGTWTTNITVIASAGLVIAVGVGLPLVTSSQLRTIARRMTFNLESQGKMLSSMPDLRKSEEFQSWCADEGLTTEDITASGQGPRPQACIGSGPIRICAVTWWCAHRVRSQTTPGREPRGLNRNCHQILHQTPSWPLFLLARCIPLWICGSLWLIAGLI